MFPISLGIFTWSFTLPMHFLPLSRYWVRMAIGLQTAEEIKRGLLHLFARQRMLVSDIGFVNSIIPLGSSSPTPPTTATENIVSGDVGNASSSSDNAKPEVQENTELSKEEIVNIDSSSQSNVHKTIFYSTPLTTNTNKPLLYHYNFVVKFPETHQFAKSGIRLIKANSNFLTWIYILLIADPLSPKVVFLEIISMEKYQKPLTQQTSLWKIFPRKPQPTQATKQSKSRWLMEVKASADIFETWDRKGSKDSKDVGLVLRKIRDADSIHFQRFGSSSKKYPVKWL